METGSTHPAELHEKDAQAVKMSHKRRNCRRVGHGSAQRGLVMCRTRAQMDSVCFAFVWTQGLDSGVGFNDPSLEIP